MPARESFCRCASPQTTSAAYTNRNPTNRDVRFESATSPCLCWHQAQPAYCHKDSRPYDLRRNSRRSANRAAERRDRVPHPPSSSPRRLYPNDLSNFRLPTSHCPLRPCAGRYETSKPVCPFAHPTPAHRPPRRGSALPAYAHP